MKNLKFVLSLLAVSLAVVACQPREKSEPKVESKVVAPSPSVSVTPSQKTDLDLVEKTSEVVVPPVPVVDPHEAFYLKSVASEIPPTEKGGAMFDHMIELNGKKLTLRGVTVRKFEMSAISLLTIYSVALYVPEGLDISGDIPDVEKVLILEYHLDVPKEKVVKAIRESVYANPDVSTPLVEADFQKLSDAFDSPKKGDRYEFPYIPNRGTAMIKSHRVMTLIPGLDFEEAFYGIWLSPHGNDLQMRCELMALPCPEKSLLNPVNAISSGLGGAKDKLGKLKNFIS